MAGACYVTDGGECQVWVINLPLQSHSCFGVEVIVKVNGLAGSVNQFHLLAVRLHRRHFDLIAQTVGQRERGFDVPGIGDVHVVEVNGVLIEHRRSHRVQRQLCAAARKQLLRLIYDTEDIRIVFIPVTYLVAGRPAGWVSLV